MSRADRRAYKRMTKSQDPYAPPAGASAAARARAQARARPRRPRNPGEFTFVSRRFLAWLIGGLVVVGLAAFSMAWPSGMPGALYVGLAAAAAWVVLALGFRYLQARMAARALQR
jgi:hypothetical protein